MKVLFVTTISDTVNAFLIPHIRLLIEEGHHVDIACNVCQEISPMLTQLGCNVYNIKFQRTPLRFQNYKAYVNLKALIYDKGYNFVHTHTPVASVCVRLACRNIENIKVVYTAHGFHFFKGGPILNWLLYYPIEFMLAKYTDVLITINTEDFQRAKKSFRAQKVEYIPGIGFDVKKFREVAVTKQEKREER